MRDLHLTSPLMSGQDVRQAQQRLKGSNVFRQNFEPGSLDGQYGEATARATKRAKFWLGYPEKAIDGGYGAKLHAYLGGKAPPTSYKTRRRQRLNAKGRKPLREKALANLTAKIGTKESPAGSNRVWASEWYGLIGSWCAMAVTWAYVKAGSKAFAKGSRWAYVPWIVNAARAGNYGLSVTRDPKPGDLVCYDWPGESKGTADHVGLFEKWLDAPDTFSAIEGNTAIGNDSNGGEVMRRQRIRSEVLAFVHVSK